MSKIGSSAIKTRFVQQTLRDNQYFKNKVFQLQREEEFSELALELFYYQARHNPVYRQYLHNLGVRPEEVTHLRDIPHLPIGFFKSHEVLTGKVRPQHVFTSSGTTGTQTSKHYVADLGHYHRGAEMAFQRVYGSVEGYCVLALLPAYLERKGSSLVDMARHFIGLSTDQDSGFYLDELDQLHKLLLKKISDKKPTLLLGVTFALLDLAEKYQLPENDLVIMETGGMKGRRKELLRTEVHALLKPRLGVQKIHSEYGMTELLSQAYSTGEGFFEAPPWMKVSIRQTDDPFSPERPGKTGGVNVIDLANIDSCAFIETQDLGRLYPDARFEIMGRFDNSDIRGCNLMVV